MIRQGVQNLGTGEDVEADQKDVVGEQHEPGPFISNAALSKGIVSKITDVLDLRVFHDVLVHSNGSDPEEYTSNHHGDDARNPS